MAKITGIGGIFVKSDNKDAREAWYAKHLGLAGEYGANLKFRDDNEEAFSVISTFAGDTEYMAPSTLPIMINLRVDDLDSFQKKLEGEGVEILDRQDEPYGKFAWIMDPDGIKIELWEQIGPAPD